MATKKPAKTKGGGCNAKTEKGKPCPYKPLYQRKKCARHSSQEEVDAARKERFTDQLALARVEDAALRAEGSELWGCGNGPLHLPDDYAGRPDVDITDANMTAVMRRLMKDADHAAGGCFYVHNGALSVVRTLPEPMLFRERATPEQAAAAEALGRVCVARLEPVSAVKMRAFLRHLAYFYRVNDQGDPVTANPPPMVIEELLELGNWTFPPIKRVTTTPFVLPGYAVASEPRYYPLAAILLAPDPETVWLPVSPTPTHEEFTDACAHLRWLTEGFVYVSKADRANHIAALLTPMIQPLVGAVPIVFYNAPKHGTGKTIASMLVQGTHMGRVHTRAANQNGTEFTAGFETALRSGESVTIWDNLNHALDNSEVAAAITSGRHTFRLKGVHGDATCEVGFHQFTMNDGRLSGELADRAFAVRQDAKMERPGDRNGFKYHIPRDVVGEQRARTVWALLTIVRAWATNGAPRWEGKFRDSFDTWSEVVGGIVTHASFTDFAGNRDEVFADHVVLNDDTAKTRVLVEAILATVGEDGGSPSFIPPTIRDLYDGLVKLAEAEAAKDLLGGVEVDDHELLAEFIDLAGIFDATGFGPAADKVVKTVGMIARGLHGKTARVDGQEYTFEVVGGSRRVANRYRVVKVE